MTLLRKEPISNELKQSLNGLMQTFCKFYPAFIIIMKKYTYHFLLFILFSLPFGENWGGTAFSQNLQWVNGFGGTGNICQGNSIAHDNAGNIMVTGSFNGTVDFDPSGITKNLSTTSGSQIFLAKYDADGNYIWAFSLGGTGNSYYSAGKCITTDAVGNIFVTGNFYGANVDFDPSTNVNSISSKGGSDIFVAKYDANGNYKWALGIGGTLNVDQGNSLITDANGNTYVTGLFWGKYVDFDPGAGNAFITSTDTVNQSTDMFTAKYDPNGNYKWTLNVGCKNTYNGGSSITEDNNGNIYVTGYLDGTADFDPGTGIDSVKSHGTVGLSDDCFIAKYDTAGNYKWAFGIGGDGNSNVESYSIASGNNGAIYLTGYIEGNELAQGAKGIDFDPSTSIDTLVNVGPIDIFLARYDTAGNYKWAFNVGSTSGANYNCAGNSIFLDNNREILMTGYMRGIVDFDPSVSIDTLNGKGYREIFVSKYDTAGNYKWAFNTNSTSAAASGQNIINDGSDIYVTGFLQGNNIDFFPGSNTSLLSAKGNRDIFIAKYDQFPTGIFSSSTNSFMNIYPNPNDGNFNLTLNDLKENTELEIKDVMGKIIYQHTINEKSSTINTTLPNGIYFLQIQSASYLAVKKIVIR